MPIFIVNAPDQLSAAPGINPLSAIWNLAKSAVNRMIGGPLGRVALVAQTIDFSAVQITDPEDLDEGDLLHTKHTVVTYDGARLDTLEIKHESQASLAIENKNYIINFVCNFMSYEQIIADMQQDARELHCNVVGFNLRGVSLSTGTACSKDDLVTDGIAQVQRLLDAGVSPENITLKGLSIGGAIATLVAGYFHAHGKRINVFNDRSFSTTSNLLIGHIRKASATTGHGRALEWVLKPIVKVVLDLAKWEVEVDKAYQSIPPNYKDYMLVRTHKAARTPAVVDDADIPHYASLHVALKAERKLKKAAIDRALAAATAVTSSGDKVAVDITALREARAAFSLRKMEYHPRTENAHTVSRDLLHNRAGTSGATFFCNFVRRAHADHGVDGPRVSVPLCFRPRVPPFWSTI